MARRSSVQDGTDSTINSLNSAAVATVNRGLAATVRAMHSVAEDTRVSTAASFLSSDKAVPASGVSQDGPRSIATGTTSEAATNDLATHAASVKLSGIISPSPHQLTIFTADEIAAIAGAVDPKILDRSRLTHSPCR